MELYLYINDARISKYDGSILKTFDGNKLVKVVANPTTQDLLDYGYKPLIDTPMPEEREGHYWARHYIDGDSITVQWTEEKIQEEEETD